MCTLVGFLSHWSWVVMQIIITQIHIHYFWIQFITYAQDLLAKYKIIILTLWAEHTQEQMPSKSISTLPKPGTLIVKVSPSLTESLMQLLAVIVTLKVTY